jgi:predicted permease
MTREKRGAAGGVAPIGMLGHDVRQAVRHLSRDWQFTVAAVLILALGIGANTAMFSIVNALLFRPYPLPDSHRLVNLYQNAGESAAPGPVSFPAYRDIVASSNVFSAVTAVLPEDARYQARDGLRKAFVEHTTSSYLDVLGSRLTAGRWFTEAEDRVGAQPVAVMGYRTWERQFASDFGIIGQTVLLNGVPVTVVGIGPRELTSTMHPTLVADFWLSMSAVAGVGGGSRSGGILERRGERNFEVRARLKEGVTLAQAQTNMDVLARQLAKDHPATDPGKGITVVPTDQVVIQPGDPDTMIGYGSALMMAIMGLLLAIACSNLATLLLVRGTGRAKEVSVRLALGASRWQLVRHFLAESVLLAMCGAAAGFVLSQWTIDYLSTLPQLSFDLRMDYRILGFAAGIGLVTGIAFGLAPALRSTKVDIVSGLRGGDGSLSFTRGWFTLKNVLLAGQVTGSFVLLMGTGVLIRMVMSMQTQELGFTTQGVAVVRVGTRFAGYGEAAAEQKHQELLRRIARIPGVQSAFATSGSPVGSSVGRQIEIDGAAGGRTSSRAESAWASPGFFETLQIPVLFGRTFQEHDLPRTPHVAVVNETMARRLFGSPNAVGRRFRYGGIEDSQEPKTEVEVVGVVRDTSALQIMTGAEPLFYLSTAQNGVETSTLVARSSLGAEGLLQAMQREVRSFDPALPVMLARTMEQMLESRFSIWEQGSAALGSLGVLALALASVGLYAVVRFSVSKRSRELGIRMALGARGGQVVWLVMRDVTILIGVAISIAGAASLAGLIVVQAATHVKVPGADAATILSVVAILAASGGAAAYFPARRAAKADPSLSLRHD